MSYEYLERMAKQDERMSGPSVPSPLTSDTFLASEISHLGGVLGSNPELDTANGTGQLRPRGSVAGGSVAAAGSVAGGGHPTPALAGEECNHHGISARGRMGKGRASPERAFAGAEGRPAGGDRPDRHTWEVRGVRSSVHVNKPKDQNVDFEIGTTSGVQAADGSDAFGDVHGRNHFAQSSAETTKGTILRGGDSCQGKVSSESPWQRGNEPGAAFDMSRLSGSPAKNLTHMDASNDSPWAGGHGAVAEPEPVAGSGYDDEYFAKMSMRDELLALNIRQLRERAANAGVDRGVVEHAVDEAEDPKLAVISLILGANDGAAATNRKLQV